MENKIEATISIIKIYNLVTDLNVSYNMDTKSFLIFDSIEKKIIRGITLNLKEFKDFLSELSNLSLWNSDYEMKFELIKN